MNIELTGEYNTDCNLLIKQVEQLRQKLEAAETKADVASEFEEYYGDALNRSWVELKLCGIESDGKIGVPEAISLIRKKLESAESALREAREQEPVHWRTVLSDSDRAKHTDESRHIVGFTRLSAAEEWVSTERDFSGWTYTIEPLYRNPVPSMPVQDDIAKALEPAVKLYSHKFFSKYLGDK